jgi:hypothetical protein
MGLETVLRRCEQGVASGETAGRRGSAGYVGPVIAGLAIALLALELLPWAHRFNPRIEADRLYAETPLIARLRAETGGGRYLAVTPRSVWRLDRVPTEAVLPPNAGTAYGLRSVDGYDSLFPADYREYAAQTEGADPAPAANGNMLLLENAPAWADKVGCVVSAAGAGTGLPDPGEVLDGCALRVTRNPRFATRAELYAFRGDELPVVLPVAITRDELNAVSLGASHPQARTVVLRDGPYPGWQAFVDGQRSDWRGNGGERHVDVPPGRSRVDWVYLPSTVVVGGFLSLCALAALVALGVGARMAGGSRR